MGQSFVASYFDEDNFLYNLHNIIDIYNKYYDGGNNERSFMTPRKSNLSLFGSKVHK